MFRWLGLVLLFHVTKEVRCLSFSLSILCLCTFVTLSSMKVPRQSFPMLGGLMERGPLMLRLFLFMGSVGCGCCCRLWSFAIDWLGRCHFCLLLMCWFLGLSFFLLFLLGLGHRHPPSVIELSWFEVRIVVRGWLFYRRSCRNLCWCHRRFFWGQTSFIRWFIDFSWRLTMFLVKDQFSNCLKWYFLEFQ